MKKDTNTPTQSDSEKVKGRVQRLIIHFNGDKAIGTYIGNTQVGTSPRFGIHICTDDNAKVGEPSDHMNGKVPNESTLAIMTFEKVESIDMMIAKLENAKRMFV